MGKDLHKEVKSARPGKHVGKYEILFSCFLLFKNIYWLAKAKIIRMCMGFMTYVKINCVTIIAQRTKGMWNENILKWEKGEKKKR